MISNNDKVSHSPTKLMGQSLLTLIQKKNANYGEKDLKYRFIPKAVNSKCQSEFIFLCLDQVAVGSLKPPGLDGQFKIHLFYG